MVFEELPNQSQCGVTNIQETTLLYYKDKNKIHLYVCMYLFVCLTHNDKITAGF